MPLWITLSMGDVRSYEGDTMTLKSAFIGALWEAGWKDGVEIKCISKPPFINYQWEIAE